MLSLDELEPYFDELDFDLEQDKVDELFEIFKSDFVDDPFELNGVAFAVKSMREDTRSSFLGNKKAANYGIAANHVKYPLDNDHNTQQKAR